MLRENDEFIEYFWDDEGTRKKKIIMRNSMRKPLTMEEVSEIKEAFSLFDKD